MEIKITMPWKLSKILGRGIQAGLLLLLGGCMSLPTPDGARQPTHAYSGQDSLLHREYRDRVGANAGKSGFTVLGGGEEAFAARLELIRKAEKSIDVQYYIAWNDTAGSLIYQSLLEAAERGVRVRILLDDLNLDGATGRLSVLDRHPNIAVRSFNPFRRDVPRSWQYLFRFGEVSRRMHNKSMVFDNLATIVGSRNVGDEAAGVPVDYIFSEFEILGVGPVAQMVSSSFDRYWNSVHSVELGRLTRVLGEAQYVAGRGINDELPPEAYQRLLISLPLAQQIRCNRLDLEWAPVELVADPPEKIRQDLKRGDFLNATALRPFIADTRRELWILNPYVVPTPEGVAFFDGLRRRGVDVTLVTNSYASTDHSLVHAHYARYRKPLLAMGVKLHEFETNGNGAACCKGIRRLFRKEPPRARLHAKIIAFDRQRTYVGTMNLDPRSLYENTELGIVIDSPALSQRITRRFDSNMAQFAYQVDLGEGGKLHWVDLGKGKRLNREPDTHVLQRLWVAVLALVPVESLL
ncbi:MAG: phospholipase D family protein [Gammaproteobacteria bacterium]|nr:phospholipase D family protein [Gammaproteobacteria bacterium]MBU1654784.1 phospholipase D family protein [Gammaproteobacteria bacterium]MBU1961435.1 phospholipase D family protein [Gammaproteobacteria bacterium]